jgi:hypothetical protein
MTTQGHIESWSGLDHAGGLFRKLLMGHITKNKTIVSQYSKESLAVKLIFR